MSGVQARLGESDALLRQTETIHVSKQDVQVSCCGTCIFALTTRLTWYLSLWQEGYDVDLLDSQPRGLGSNSSSAPAMTILPVPTRPDLSHLPSSPSASIETIMTEPVSPLPTSSSSQFVTALPASALSDGQSSPRRVHVSRPASHHPRNAAQSYAARARAAEIAHEARNKEDRSAGKWWAFWTTTGGSGTGAIYSEMKPEGDDRVEEDAAEKEPRISFGPEPVVVSARNRRCCGFERRMWMWIGALVLACILIGVAVGVGVGVGLKIRHGDGEPEPDTAIRPPLLGGQTSATTPLSSIVREAESSAAAVESSVSAVESSVAAVEPTFSGVESTFSPFEPDPLPTSTEEPWAPTEVASPEVPTEAVAPEVPTQDEPAEGW